MKCRCRICSEDSDYVFTATLLNKYDVRYYQCPECQFLQTDEPYWLNEAYEYPINIEDTGLVSRNILLAKRTSTILYFLFKKEAVFLDYASGYGLFVRLMRDYGFNFLWSDIHTKNILAKGFEYNPTVHNNIELVTAMECFEHFSDPIKEIERLLIITPNILFSTETFNKSVPAPNEWDYYGFTHGQHVSLYSQKTLQVIAQKFKLNLYTNGKSYHLLTKKHFSNFVFNLLLKVSLFGIPSFIKWKMGSKVLSDSVMMKNK
jgi:hypothetical protein